MWQNFFERGRSSNNMEGHKTVTTEAIFFSIVEEYSLISETTG